VVNRCGQDAWDSWRLEAGAPPCWDGGPYRMAARHQV